jgi:PAS domain S-box-containing protein
MHGAARNGFGIVSRGATRSAEKLITPIDRLIELDQKDAREQQDQQAFSSRMDAVIEALPDALVVADDDGKIVLFNKQAEFMFGYHRSEAIGQMVEKLLPERARPRHVHDRQMYSRYNITKRARTMGVGMELIGIRGDGHEFLVDITLSRMVVPAGTFNLALIRYATRPAGDTLIAPEPTGSQIRSEPAQNIEDANAGQ